MSHQLPTHQELICSAKVLKDFYKNGEDSQRIHFIQLLNELIKKTELEQTMSEGLSQIELQKLKHNSDRAITGALVYELEWIKQVQYKGYSPDKHCSIFAKVTGKGSDIYTKIKAILHVNSHERMTDDERLICLNQFYWAVKKYFPQNISLQENIYVRLKQVKRREMKRIGMFVDDLPIFEVLEKDISEIADKYHKVAKFKNPYREKALTFINFITKISKPYVLSEVEKNSVRKEGFLYMQMRNADVGAVLFVMLEISQEKKYVALSPERSQLFRECADAINVKHFKKLDPEKKIKWLRALSAYLDTLKSLNNEKLNAECVNAGLGNIKKLKDKVEQFISAEEVKKASPSWTNTIANGIVRYGLGFTLAHYTAETVFMVVEGTLVGATGPIGLVTYLAGGTILMTQFGQLITKNMITPGFAYLYGWTLDKVSESIVSNTLEAAIHTYLMTPEGFRDIFIKATPLQQAFIQEWIDTLLTLPEGIMPPKEKDQIKHIRDIVEMPVEKPTLKNESAMEEDGFVMCTRRSF